MTAPRSRRWRRVAYVGLTLAITTLLLESTSCVLLRGIAEQTDVSRSETHLLDAHRDHRLNPDFELGGRSWHAPDGFRRDKAVSLDKPDQTIRIVALGTSALYGLGASSPYPTHPPLHNDETITHHLEQALAQRLARDGIEHRVEVLNAGVSAYKTFHELVYLNASLLDYQPDIVINVDGHNDFYDDDMNDRWNEYAYSTSILVDQFNGRTFFLAGFGSVRALAPYSQTFNLGERLMRRAWQRRVERPLLHTPHRDFQRGANFAATMESLLDRQALRELWQIHALGRYANFDHAIFLQPEIVFEREDTLSPEDRKLRQITMKWLPQDVPEKMRQVRELLPEWFQRRELPLVDLGEIGAEETSTQQLYLDYCHLSPDGARVTAQRIADSLYPTVKARIR